MGKGLLLLGKILQSFNWRWQEKRQSELREVQKTIRSQRRFDEKLSLLSVSHPLYIIFASILSQSHKAAIIGLVIRNYGRSLVFGTRYIYESMPRLLTLWFDFSKLTGLNADGVKAQQSDLRLARLNQLHRIMQKFVDKLPPFQASHVQLCLPVFFFLHSFLIYIPSPFFHVQNPSQLISHPSQILIFLPISYSFWLLSHR